MKTTKEMIEVMRAYDMGEQIQIAIGAENHTTASRWRYANSPRRMESDCRNSYSHQIEMDSNVGGISR